ncbi:MAG: hypothetical protein P8184_09870 [Calditrichia bacterium]
MFFNKHLFGLDKISLTERDISDLFGLAGWLKSDDRENPDSRKKENPRKLNRSAKRNHERR